MNPNQIQQGDVRLEKVDVLPADCKLVKRSQNGVIIEESKTTNNRHYVLAPGVNLLVAPSGDRFLVNENEEAAELLHSKDHKPLIVRPGAHLVGAVHEMDHTTKLQRKVID